MVVNEIPQHSRRMIERLLDGYCARICPPGVRNSVRLSYRIDIDHVTLFELQRICGVPGTQQPVPVAEFRYRTQDGVWRLAWRDPQGLWRNYAQEPRQRTFLEWLREFDRDPDGRFWTRVDGKSLRWCSSRGRCDGCEEKYCQVLGLAPTATHSLGG
jgi:Protein of unknown function (DUF3024)